MVRYQDNSSPHMLGSEVLWSGLLGYALQTLFPHNWCLCGIYGFFCTVSSITQV